MFSIKDFSDSSVDKELDNLSQKVKIINNHKKANSIKWYISFYCNNDIKRIEEFAKNMQISTKQIKIFKM